MSCFKLDYPNTIKKDVKLYDSPEKLLLTAGPCNVSARVLRAISKQTILPLTKEFFKLIDEIQEMSKYVFQTKNSLTLVQQTSGNGGNETLLVNLVDPGETIIVATSGVWGVKVADMGRRYGANVVELTSKPGEVFTFNELESQIIKHKPVALFVTHGESSGGTLQPLDGLGKICHKYNCLLVVDAVVSLACSPLFVDRWEIDAAVGGSQKAIGAPPGLSILTLSSLAYEKTLKKKKPTPYYYDLKELSSTWNCFKQDTPRIYHYTYNSNMLMALREALAQICEEGLENVWRRHKESAEQFWKGLEKHGMKCFVKKPENRFWGVTTTVLPAKVAWPQLLDYIDKKHGVELSFGIGPSRQVAIRLGLLGLNARPEVVEYLLEILSDGIHYCQKNEFSNGANDSTSIHVP